MPDSEKMLYAEFKVRVLVPRDKLPDTIDGPDPFEDPLDELKSSIQQIEWEGLTHHEGVKIEVTDE